jgi:hypothetical protein
MTKFFKIRAFNILKGKRYFLSVLYRIKKIFAVIKKSKISQIKSISHQRSVVSRKENIIILGHNVPTQKEWNSKLGKPQSYVEKFDITSKNSNLNSEFVINDPMVSILISLYKSELYLEKFLNNLEMQTMINNLEPFFMLVQPTEVEINLVSDFCRSFPKSNFIVVEKRITIYEAWNIAISKTNSPYITNMNVDDARRPDSLQIQLETFYQHPWADVVYQDFYFTLEPHLEWKQIVDKGFKTNLPPVTLSDLVLFGINAPHNAPMWRRELHSELGLFNGSLKSAGDYDFWIKCAAQGKKFIKTRDCHVAYFVNPEGMSTGSESPSSSEERELQNLWKAQFVKSFHTMRQHSKIAIPESNADQKLLKRFMDLNKKG